MRSVITLLFSVLAIAACDKIPKLGPATDDQLASASEDACGYIQNSYGQRVSWKGNLPVSILIDANFPASYESALHEAAKLWEDAAGMTLFKFSRTPNVGTNGIYWQTSWDDTQRGMQALTSLRWYKNQLVEAKVKIDARYFKFYMNAPSSSYDIHFQSLLVHELGHALGMKHKNLSPTVMWATLGGTTVREKLSDSDIQSLKCEY